MAEQRARLPTDWRCLSLTQPWPWIILYLGKRIENRSRNIGDYRGPLLIHAAKGMTDRDWWSAYDFVAKHFGHVGFADRIPQPRALARGAIVGRCNVVDSFDHHDVAAYVRSHAVIGGGGAEPEDDSPPWPDGQERWYMGAHAYVLDDVAPTKIVPCKGALGFWRPSAGVLAELGLEVAGA